MSEINNTLKQIRNILYVIVMALGMIFGAIIGK